MNNFGFAVLSAAAGFVLVVAIMLVVFEVGWRVQTYHLRKVTEMMKEAEKNGNNCETLG